MYLKTLHIKKFRSIDEMEIKFNKGINIIIGENNAGKTAVIDALRICLSYGKQWRDIGIQNDEDFYIDCSDVDCPVHPIEFHLHFTIEDDSDRNYFASMLWQDPEDSARHEIQMHFRYWLEHTSSGSKKLKWSIWGGSMEGQLIDSNEAQLLYYTYLAPLRNAEQELKPYAKDNKITSLFRELSQYDYTDPTGAAANKKLDNNEKNSLALKLETVIADEEWKGLIGTGAHRVNEHLEKADIRKRNSIVNLRLMEYKYENIIKGIITRKPVFDSASIPTGQTHKQRFFDVSQNGLGENNLIFASSVLGDLKNRRFEKKEHYYALFLEEPEAHLHPQKQITFFNYLNNLKELDLQLFITSHSPTLTAKSDLDNLIILQQQSGIKHAFTLKDSPASEKNKSYLRKFLDVTKSQLFFSNGALLVEGISEALLLSSLAKIHTPDYDLDANGIETVNINGVAFEPFAVLYNSALATNRLSSRCAILSDDDRGILSATDIVSPDAGIDKPTSKQIFAKLITDNVIDSSNRIVQDPGYVYTDLTLNAHSAFVTALIDARRELISARARNASGYSSGNLQTHLSKYTFEYELMTASERNYRLMMYVYHKKMHRNTKFLLSTEPMKLRALDFVAKLDRNKDKSEFAQRLAMILSERSGVNHFTVPKYIQKALTWVIEGE